MWNFFLFLKNFCQNREPQTPLLIYWINFARKVRVQSAPGPWHEFFFSYTSALKVNFKISLLDLYCLLEIFRIVFFVYRISKYCMAQSSDVWIFGYGSLIWKPSFEFSESVFGFVLDWERKFWQVWIAGKFLLAHFTRVQQIIEGQIISLGESLR